MSQSEPRLELTCGGKERRRRLETRIFLEDLGKSYHAKQRVIDNDEIAESNRFTDFLRFEVRS